MSAINNQLTNFQKTLENNTLRINHIFNVLNFDDGDDIWLFGIADYESEVRFSKFKMADSIWWIK